MIHHRRAVRPTARWSVRRQLTVFLSGAVTDQRPVLQFVIWVFGASVLHTWMYERTGGSVLLVTLFHGALNTASSLLLPLFTGAAYGWAWWFAAATMTAAATLVVWRSGDWTTPLPEAVREPQPRSAEPVSI
jgi:uncharacterized protein